MSTIIENNNNKADNKTKAFRVTRRVLRGNFKNEEQKATLEKKLNNLESQLTSEEKQWVADRITQFQTKQANKKQPDSLKVAIQINRKFLVRGGAENIADEQKRENLNQRLEKALENLTSEQKQALDKAVEAVKTKLAKKAERESNPEFAEKKRVQRFIGLWKKINNNKANEKQKAKFEEIESKMTESQKTEADEKIKMITEKRANKPEKTNKKKINNNNNMKTLLNEFKTNFSGLNESEKKAFESHFGDSLAKMAEIAEKRTAHKNKSKNTLEIQSVKNE